MLSKLRTLKVIKRDDGIDYFNDFLDLVKLPLIYMSEMKNASQQCYAIRHDVIHDINAALLMAEAESQRGYKSTYYLLTPGSYGGETNYYGTLRDGMIAHDPELVHKCRRFIDLGHEIGFLNEVLSLAFRFKQSPADILKRETEFFVQNGIPLVGTASHESSLAHELEYMNLEIFEDCFKPGWERGRIVEYEGWQIRLHSLKLIDYGFHYEASSLQKDARISDFGSQWVGKIGERRIKDYLGDSFGKEKFCEMLTWLDSADIHSLQIQVNPCHWDVFDEAGIKISPIERPLSVRDIRAGNLPKKSTLTHTLRTLKVIKRDDGIDYFNDFLDLVNLPLVHISELREKVPPRYFIRHDVDHDIDTALLIAEAEAQRGYKSTYFLLTPGSYGEKSNYYGALESGLIVHQPDLIEKCRRFIGLGHEIGLHNDVVSLSLMLQKNPEEILRREVDFFADSGVPLIGTAAHGNPLGRKLKYSNYEIFSDCIRKRITPDQIGRSIEYRNWRVKLHRLRLADFGFKYEVYFVYRNSDIADTGSRWLAELMAGAPKGTLAPPMTKEEFKQRLSAFVAQPIVTSLQILHHPCHWDVYDEGRNKISVMVRSRPGGVVNRVGTQLETIAGDVLKTGKTVQSMLKQTKEVKGKPSESTGGANADEDMDAGKTVHPVSVISSTLKRGLFSQIFSRLRVLLFRRHK